MDHLWSPWRYRYVTKADPAEGCVFCSKPAEQNDRANLVLHRATYCYVILNLYPYTTGHMLIVPYQHVATLEDTPSQTLHEMMDLVKTAAASLQRLYKPQGINAGLNLGECAGAGIAGHIHMHVLPRWPGDVNFMTSIAETRILPEDLDSTYDRMLRAFSETLNHPE